MVEPVAEVLRERVPATAANVGHRRVVRRWLSAVLEDPDAVEELTMAVSEAVENAVDHAFADTSPGMVLLEARTVQGIDRSDSVVLTISDDGCWLPATAPGFRGRGLALIAACCPAVRIESDGTGTRVVLRYPS